MIDDLEEYEVSQESIDRALEINHAIEIEDRHRDLLGALPFGLLALIGAVLGGYGAATQFGMIQSNATVTSSISIYLPPFLMLLGILLFFTMAYYFLRTLRSEY